MCPYLTYLDIGVYFFELSVRRSRGSRLGNTEGANHRFQGLPYRSEIQCPPFDLRKDVPYQNQEVD
jgi:hypothetical protein